ncbi:MAG: hypothetical protein ACREP9_08345 [Candidatus Dormibacteraceae bacterium]
MPNRVSRPGLRPRERGHTHLSRKYQVTLGQDAVRQAGLAVGEKLRVDVDAQGRITLERIVDPVDAMAGAFHGIPADFLSRLRDEWEVGTLLTDLDQEFPLPQKTAKSA